MKYEFLVDLIIAVLAIIFFAIIFITLIMVVEVVNFILGQEIPEKVRLMVICYLAAIFVVGCVYVAKKTVDVIKYFR